MRLLEAMRPPIGSPATADIPPRYEKCDLDNFHDYNDSLSKAVGRARRFVEEFPAVDRGLLSVRAARSWEDAPGDRVPEARGPRPAACAASSTTRASCFGASASRTTRCREQPNPSVTSSTPLSSADLLVLDDIGAERATEWVEEMLHLIVNARYNDRRPTIFTTNYPIEPPSDAKHAETLLERVGFRMYSRLQEMTDFVHLEGEDYREVGPNPSAEQLARLSQRGSRTHKQLPSPSAKSQLKARFRSTGPAPELEVARRQGGVIGKSQVTSHKSQTEFSPPESHGPRNSLRRTSRAASLTLNRVLGLYVHIPFCSAICNYCNFNRGLFDAALKDQYLAALLTEIDRAGDGSPADTIYFGGGTPSLLEPDRGGGASSRPVAGRGTSRQMPRSRSRRTRKRSRPNVSPVCVQAASTVSVSAFSRSETMSFSV